MNYYLNHLLFLLYYLHKVKQILSLNRTIRIDLTSSLSIQVCVTHITPF